LGGEPRRLEPARARLSHRRPALRTPLGEIDLVARRGRLLAFVEVKARTDLEQALVALSPRQRQRTARAAELFLLRRPDLAGHTLRFDLIAVRPWRLPRHLSDVWRLS
jgi:putative endonuclease